MNELIVPETGLPLRFPDPREEAFARAQEFSRLSSEARWQEIVTLMEWGLNMARNSPRRESIENRWEAQEEEWRLTQRLLLVQHGN